MTPLDVRTAFPKFKDVGDPTINAAITSMAPFFNEPARYGDFLGNAQLELVAHFILVNLPDQGLDRGVNDAVSETRPTLQVSRSPELLRRQANDPFMKTSHGQMFCYYRERAGMGGAAAVLSQARAPQLWGGGTWGGGGCW